MCSGILISKHFGFKIHFRSYVLEHVTKSCLAYREFILNPEGQHCQNFGAGMCFTDPIYCAVCLNLREIINYEYHATHKPSVHTDFFLKVISKGQMHNGNYFHIGTCSPISWTVLAFSGSWRTCSQP